MLDAIVWIWQSNRRKRRAQERFGKFANKKERMKRAQKSRACKIKTTTISIPQKQKIKKKKKTFEGEMPSKTFQPNTFPMGKNHNEAAGTYF